MSDINKELLTALKRIEREIKKNKFDPDLVHQIAYEAIQSANKA